MCRVISTHDGEDNPFNELIKEVRSGKRAGTVHRITFNEAVEQGLYKRVCLRKKLSTTQLKSKNGLKVFINSMAMHLMKSWMLFQVKVVDAGLHYHYLNQKDDTVPVIRFEAPKGWDDFDKVSEETRNAEVLEFFNEHLKPVLENLPTKANSFYGLDFARKQNACSFWPLIEQQNTRKSHSCLRCSKFLTSSKRNF
jgi:phage FluMu gp28-like protein